MNLKEVVAHLVEFQVGLNRLDFIIVAAASLSYLSAIFDNVIPNMKDAAVFRILRMTRLLRAARVAKIILRSEQLRRMLSRAFAARDAILSLCGLLCFFLAIASIVAEEFFSSCPRHDVEAAEIPRPNFDGFGSSFIAVRETVLTKISQN